MTPQRIQLRRTKGARKPEDSVVVSRPTKWGNPWSFEATEPGWWWVRGPFEVTFLPLETESDARAVVVDIYREYVSAEGFRGLRPTWLHDDVEDELRGRDLACWCPLDQPCHVDVLLELANASCPAGGEHTWTDDVGPEHEHLPRSARWHCDECGASPPSVRSGLPDHEHEAGG